MKTSRSTARASLGRIFSLRAALAMAVLGSAALIAAPDASAQPKKKETPTKPAKASPGSATTTKKTISIQPADLVWGIDKKKLGSIYDKVIEEDYKFRYKKVQPGPEMDRLDAEVTEKKSEFRRSEIKFENMANGMDATPLRPEYSYNNKEFLLSIDRGGKTRYFFFINEKLWKVVDAIKLGERSPWGKTFDEAVKVLSKYYGAEGRVLQPDEAAGREFKEVDWKDSTTHVRAVSWSDDRFALIFEESATVAQLSTLRKNKLSNAKDIDSKVKESAKGAPGSEPAPKDAKPKKK